MNDTLDLIVTFMTFFEWHYLDLIVTFVTFLWTTQYLDLNCDLFINDTI